MFVQCLNESSASFKKMAMFERVLIEVSVKVNLGVSLKLLVFANLESVGCEIKFPGKKILKF